MPAYQSLEDAIRAARVRLPVSALLSHRGFQAGPQKFRCPFCESKSAEVKPFNGVERFKCWHSPCAADGKSLDEIGILELLVNQPRRDTLWMWLKEAGIPREEVGYPRQSQPVVTARPHKSEPQPESDPQPEAESAAEVVEITSKCEPTPDSTVSTPVQTAPEQSEIITEQCVSAPVEIADESEHAQDEDAATLIKREFWTLLMVTGDDEDKLFRKRGLVWEPINAFGIKSSLRHNEEILKWLAAKHGIPKMVRAGLYHYPKHRVRRGSEMEAVELESSLEEARPNQQFCGWGIANQRQQEWDWTFPPIIPYTNMNGDVVDLRPHKGGIRVDWSSYNAAQRFYVARRIGKRDEPSGAKVAMITEGEFKAIAFYQTLNWTSFSPPYPTPRYLAAAMPGIQAAHNHYVFDACVRWLERVAPEKVIVVFDNENKSDPKLPGYKPFEADRYEAEVWAIRTAQLLKREGFAASLSRLPDSWRNENGKADWDGYLASILNRDTKA